MGEGSRNGHLHPPQERGSPSLEVQDMNGAERQTHMTLPIGPDLSFPPEKQLQGVPPIPSAQRPVPR